MDDSSIQEAIDRLRAADEAVAEADRLFQEAREEENARASDFARASRERLKAEAALLRAVYGNE